MAVPSAPPEVIPIAALTWAPAAGHDEVRAAVEAAWGTINGESDSFDFDVFTDYYAAEMGTGLMKRIVAFEASMPPDSLVERKLDANDLEMLWQDDAGNRAVNIDPGYLTPSALVLATAKHKGHRVYLRDGIYAEMALWYHEGAYKTFPWTYSDYAQDAILDTLSEWRPHAVRLQDAWKRERV